jgi:GntR family transcriptional regulator, transcriptional repressor for pyruvate dehydrogenase complex
LTSPTSDSSSFGGITMQRTKPGRLRRQRLSDQLTTQLRRLIIDRGLKPGDPLLTEQEMIDRFGVSRSVVREATKALDFLGIIDAVPRRGTFLAEFDFGRVAEYFGFHFALTDYPREKLLKTRLVIETGVLYYTMEAIRKDPACYHHLLELADRGSASDELEERIKHDIAFHRGLVEASDIPPLAAFAELLQIFFQRFQQETAKGNFDGGKRGHRQIVEALKDGKLEEAIDALRLHLRWYSGSEPAAAGGQA